MRGRAAAGLLALLGALSGCAGAPHHPGWVIHSALEVVGAPPAGGYRLVFPYIVGDFYGSPNTGDFVAPVSQTATGFILDLNATQQGLESELGPTEFSLRFLKIVPADARVARLTPIALQREGIEPIGSVEWLDAQSDMPLMLVYVDRPARIEGAFTRGGVAIRYDIRVGGPGYAWIGTIRSGENETLYTVVPAPQRLVLKILTQTPKRRMRPDRALP